MPQRAAGLTLEIVITFASLSDSFNLKLVNNLVGGLAPWYTNSLRWSVFIFLISCILFVKNISSNIKSREKVSH